MTHRRSRLSRSVCSPLFTNHQKTMKIGSQRPHKETRVKVKFALLPKRIHGEGKSYWIWLQRYRQKQVWYAHGESVTGYDYTPRGWHELESFEENA